MRTSLPLHLALSAIMNVFLVWALDTYVDQYVIVYGGWTAYIIIGALMTLLNISIRPLLNAVTLPLKLLATILAIILVNGIFLWLVYSATLLMDPDLIVLTIDGGIGGWIVASLALGLGNWVIRVLLK